jgi:hypothetical protein
MFSQSSRAKLNAATKLARKVELQPGKAGEPILLCMNRAVLATDILALRQRTGFGYGLVSAAHFESLLAGCVPKSEQIQTFFTRTYYNLPSAVREELKSVTRRFFDACADRFKFHAVVVGNADYWQDEPVKDVCRERGLPFVVLCRENYVVTYEQELLLKRISQSGFHFAGTVNAVASIATQQTMLKSGGYRPEQIRVTGWPRFDGWIDRPAEEPGKNILLVAYQQKTYLAPENFRDVLRSFVSSARRSGEPARFYIKLKKASHIKDLIWACPSIVFSGVRFVSAVPLEQLIRSSAMVIGYNTTGLLEAYLSQAAVAVPWWKDAVRGGESNLINEDDPRDKATTHFPATPDALQDLIDEALKGKLPPKGTAEQRLKQFQRYIAHDPSETASARFETLVRDCLRLANKTAMPISPD